MGYMAPELGKGAVDSSIDMFSFGVVLYEMTTAYKPTAVKNFKYGSGPIPFRNVDWRKRNRNLQGLIELMLHMDASKRISAADALNHPWFAEETDWAEQSSQSARGSPNLTQITRVKSVWEVFSTPTTFLDLIVLTSSTNLPFLIKVTIVI